MIIVHEFKSVIENFMTQYDGLEAKTLAEISAFNKGQRVKRSISTINVDPSECKWKMKKEEWNFHKYLLAGDMNVMIAKAEKRRRDEGKETAFYVGILKSSRRDLTPSRGGRASR